MASELLRMVKWTINKLVVTFMVLDNGYMKTYKSSNIVLMKATSNIYKLSKFSCITEGILFVMFKCKTQIKI